MKKTNLIILFILLSSQLFSQQKGHLLIIGGGTIPDYLIQKYVELAGGKNSKYLIIPLASSEPRQAVNSFAKKLLNAGCLKIESIISSKENIDNDSNLAKIKGVKGVFFTGGDQSKLTSAMLDSKILELIKEIYKNGGVIGGTSAGAAVMSSIMITGKEIINKDTNNAYNVIKKENIQTTRGFAFLDNAIVDQHFIKRKRMNRLISLVLENPTLLGIGIDESTAIIINSDKSIEVIGESLVMIFDARKAEKISSNNNNYQSARNIQMHMLKNGDTFFPFDITNVQKRRKK